MLPVDKQNVLRSGIVAEKDKDLIVDTVYIACRATTSTRASLMIVDMLSNYDWTRPIYLTQPYIFQKFGLVDYLQFDGYAYRFVPILTPYRQAGEVGRIDPEYAVPLLLDVFRYGNLDDEKVYSDYFTQYNLSAARAREAFARVAQEAIRRGDEKPNFPDSLGITEATNREPGDPSARRGDAPYAARAGALHLEQHAALHRSLLCGRRRRQGRRPDAGLRPQPDGVRRLLLPVRRLAIRFDHRRTGRETRPAGQPLLDGRLPQTRRRADRA